MPHCGPRALRWGDSTSRRFRRWALQMQRREFISLLGAAAAAWSPAARAQARAQLIGFLANVSPTAKVQQVAGFHEGLNQTGYIEGHNIALEYRWANGQFDRLPGMAADLVRRRVAVIF